MTPRLNREWGPIEPTTEKCEKERHFKYIKTDET